MANKKEEEVRVVRSVRIPPADFEKIVIKYGGLTNFINICILEKIRGQK